MSELLNAFRLLIVHLFGIWNTATFMPLLVLCGAYMLVKLIKGMVRM